MSGGEGTKKIKNPKLTWLTYLLKLCKLILYGKIFVVPNALNHPHCQGMLMMMMMVAWFAICDSHYVTRKVALASVPTFPHHNLPSGRATFPGYSFSRGTSIRS